MLASLHFVLREWPVLQAFEGDSGVISCFLGPPPNLSLSDACAIGSTKLLDWIWASSVARTSGWSLCNYLRSDQHYYNWQFTKSLAEAAKRGDVKTAEWVIAHFSNCEADEEVVEAAAENGQLHFLEYLLSLGDGGGVVVHWGRYDMEKAVRNGHTPVVRWLFERTAHENSGRHLDSVIRAALWQGNVALAKLLVPRDRSIFDYTTDCPNGEFIEEMLARGYLPQDLECLDDAVGNSARIGDLHLLQTITLLYPPDHRGWYRALEWAAKRCDLTMIRWLVDHPVCHQLFEIVKRDHNSNRLLLRQLRKKTTRYCNTSTRKVRKTTLAR